MEIWWKVLKEYCFENRRIGHFAQCSKWPQTKLKESGSKSTLHMCTVGPQVPNFPPFCSTISRFRDISHFRIFPLTPMLKFHSATKFVKLGWLAREVIAYLHSIMVANVLIAFDWHRMKTVGVAFWNFQPPYGSVLTKISKCHNIFNFWLIAKKSNSLYSLITIIFVIKFEIVGEVAFWNFGSYGVPC